MESRRRFGTVAEFWSYVRPDKGHSRQRLVTGGAQDVVGDVSIAFLTTGIEPIRPSHRTNEVVGSELGDRARSGAPSHRWVDRAVQVALVRMAATMRPCWDSAGTCGSLLEPCNGGGMGGNGVGGRKYGPFDPLPICFCLELLLPHVLSRALRDFQHPLPLPPQTPSRRGGEEPSTR